MLRFIYLDGHPYWLVIHFNLEKAGVVRPTGAALHNLEFTLIWDMMLVDIPTSLRKLITDECNRASRQIMGLGPEYAFKLGDPDS